MGSSAAITTSVVAVLLNYLGVVNRSSYNGAKHEEKLYVVHIIAQTTQSYGSREAGSGVDVRSTVCGSHRYVLFSPQVISSDQIFLTAINESVGGEASKVIRQGIVKALFGAGDVMLNILITCKNHNLNLCTTLLPNSKSW